ncbi:MAG: hypothetical protein FJ211_02775 [Ignavibacteria bacterium]|nr:hypothetical protein [Ignavibacteria bacterium]
MVLHKFCIALTVFVGCLVIPFTAHAQSTPRLSAKSAQSLVYFERNVGQARYSEGERGSAIDAIVRTNGTLAYIHAKGLQMAQSRMYPTDKHTRQEPDYETDVYRVDMELVGSNPTARAEFGDELPGLVRYINNQTGVAGIDAQRYRSITYREVWPNIDLRMYLTTAGVKYDFIVHPGGNPADIAMSYTGGSSPTVSKDGGLLITTPLGELNEQAPVVWTKDEHDDFVSSVASSFATSGKSVRFNIGSYDNTKILVIDPQRLWSTYISGSQNVYSNVNGISPTSLRTTFDSTGNVILAGTTPATDMPNTPGVLQRRLKGRFDCFISKFDETGTFKWHTYYGGSLEDILHDVTTDPSGNVWACGETKSRNLPDSLLVGSNDDLQRWADIDSIARIAGFVLKLQPDGKWSDSWLVDDRENDRITGIAVTKDKVAIVGSTNSPLLGFMNGDGGFKKDTTNFSSNYDIFMATFKLNAQGRWGRNYHIFYGGGGMDYGGKVAIDSDGNIIFNGLTQSTNFPVTDGSPRRGDDDNVIVKFGATPTRLWATQYGSTGQDQPSDMALDGQNAVVVVGYTLGTDFPTTTGAFKTARQGFVDGYIRKHNSAGAVQWSTYYGGDSTDYAYGVAVDKSNNVWVAGVTFSSSNIPLTPDAHQSAPYTATDYVLKDGFIGKLDSTGKKLLYGSYYGAPPQATLPIIDRSNPTIPPPNTDFGSDLAVDIACDRSAYVSIATIAETFRMGTTPGAYQDSAKLYQDTTRAHPFISYFTQCKDSVISITPNGPATLCDVDARQLLAPNGYARYEWSTGEKTRVITVRDTGTYQVMCMTSEGCRYKTSLYIARNPKPLVSAGRDTILCNKSSIQINAVASGGKPPYRFKWNRVETGTEFVDNDTIPNPNINPGSTSRYEITVTDSNGCAAKDTMLVTVIDPRPTLSPSSTDFGTLDACTSSSEQDVTVNNPYDYPIVVTGMTPDDPRVSLVTNLAGGIPVAPKSSVNIRLSVTAATAGTTNGFFSITGTPCSWSARTTYTVTKAQLTALVVPSTVSFGAGVECETAPKTDTVVIKNRGVEPLIIKPAIVKAPYTVLDPTAEITIDPGKDYTVKLQYTPTLGAHSEEAKFAFTSGACKDTLRVKLNAVTSAVTVVASTPSINLGTLSGCENQRDTTVIITNNSDVAIKVSLPLDPEVVYTPAGPLDIGAKSSLEVQVSVRPGAAGAFSKISELSIEPCAKKLSISYGAQKNGVAFSVPTAIDFGEFSTCSPAPSITKTGSLSFDGTGSASIKSVSTGSSLSATLSQGQPLTPGTPLAFNLTWTPAAEGQLIDSVVVVFDPCDVRRVIRVTGVRTRPSLRADNAVTNLGTIAGSATGTVRYTNNGTDTLLIGLQASVGTAVTATRPANLAALLPGAQVEVDFLTGCDNRTAISDTIQAVVTSPCVSSAVSIINATCEQTTTVSTSLVVDSVAVKVGELFVVPVRIVASSGLTASKAKTWTAKVTYDPMVVVGRGNTPDCYIPATTGTCTSQISGVRGNDTTGVLFALNFTALLGSAARTSLTLSDFAWTEAAGATITSLPGSVRITDICESGGSRFVKPRTSGVRLSVYPTPATDDVAIDASGMGNEQLRWVLSSSIGQSISAGSIVPDGSGLAHQTIDVRSLPAGVYVLSVDARGETTHTTVLIQR